MSFSSYCTDGGRVGAIRRPPEELGVPLLDDGLIRPPATPGTGALAILPPWRCRMIPIGCPLEFAAPSSCCSILMSLVGEEAASSWSLEPVAWTPLGQTFVHLM